MEIANVRARQGWSWITEALRLFRRGPITWVVVVLTLLFIGAILAKLSLIGPLIFALLTPIFTAGLMLACRDVEAGKPLQVSYLFRGFQHNAAQLIAIGGVYVVGQVVISAVLFSLGGEDLRAALKATLEGTADTQTVVRSHDRIVFAVIVAAALFIPLAMAVWFAPALVALQSLPAIAAMKLSIRACLNNLPAMLIYTGAIAGILFGLVTVLQLVLGGLSPALSFVRGPAHLAVLAVWMTLTLISLYTSYRDVFVPAQPVPATPA